MGKATGKTKMLQNYSYVKRSTTIKGEPCKPEKGKYIGYCHYGEHLGYLTQADMKEHRCSEKNCRYFEKMDSPQWEMQEKKKANSKLMTKVRKRYLAGEISNTVFSELETEYKTNSIEQFYNKYTSKIDEEWVIVNKSIHFEQVVTTLPDRGINDVVIDFRKQMNELTKNITDFLYSTYNKNLLGLAKEDLVLEITSSLQELLENKVSKMTEKQFRGIDTEEFKYQLSSKLREIAEVTLDDFSTILLDKDAVKAEDRNIAEAFAVTEESQTKEANSKKQIRDCKIYMGMVKNQYKQKKISANVFRGIERDYNRLSKAQFYNKYVVNKK